MSYIEKSLSKNEVVYGIFSLNFIYFFMPLVLFSLFVSSLGVISYYVYEGKLNLYTLILPLFIFFIFLHKYLTLKSIEYGVTSLRIFAKKGLLSINTEEMFNNSIETIEISQSFLGRIFNFGDIKVTGKGNSVIILEGISDPIEAKKKIESNSLNN